MLPRVRNPRLLAPLLLALVATLAGGCGGGSGAGFTKAGPPAPQDCVRRYNNNTAALALGAHAYGPGHNSRAAHVFKITDEANQLKQSCAVIFNAANTDREYGILGGIEYPFGWDYTTQFQATPQKRAEIQKLGAEQANVSLQSDGSLGTLK